MERLTIARDFYRRELTIEKSRFICSLQKVTSEAAAQDFIRAVKKEYWDATHNCSAYIVDELAQRSSDDGEPAGTAGLPMLEVLRKKQLTCVAAVVTRYFGGIKLGAGGLVRAYSRSVAEALEECGLAERVLLARYCYCCELAEAGKLLNLVYRQKIFELTEVTYGATASFYFLLEPAKQRQAELWLTEQLNCNCELEFIAEEYREKPLEGR